MNGKMIKEISAGDLENSFRKSVRIEVTGGKALAAVLEQTDQSCKILAPNVAEENWGAEATLNDRWLPD